MFLTRENLDKSLRLSILENLSAKQKDKINDFKNYILNEMSYEEAINMVFNPLGENFESIDLLESVVFEWVKEVESERITLYEHNRGKKRSIVSVLKEQKSSEEKKGSWTARGAELGAKGAKWAAKKSTKIPGAAAKGVGHFPHEAGKGAVRGFGGERTKKLVDKYSGSKAEPYVKGAIGAGLAAGTAGAATLAARKLAKRRARKKQEKEARKRAKTQPNEQLEESISKMGAGTLAYGTYQWAKNRGKDRQKAALEAAITMEAAAELSLGQGNWDYHIIALQEARKWIDRAYSS